MTCEIICVAGFLCMSNLDIVHISSAYVHVICILSKHMCIMCILSAVVLDIFLPNRQCQCHPYIIFSTLYILSWRICHLHPLRMTCHPHPLRMMCHPHPLQMTCHPHPLQMTCHLHPLRMTCHPHPFRMTGHLHCKETCLTSLKSEKQVTGQPDN